jgi:hypothetical protein
MMHYADKLASSGAPLHDDELVTYILAGMEEDYNLVFTAIIARVDPVSPSDLCAQLLSFEQHNHLQMRASSLASSSAMTATQGHCSTGCGAGGSDQGYSRGRGCGGTLRGRGRSSGASRPQCQVCLKLGHTANCCWHCFDEDYVPKPSSATTTSGPGADNAWYTDSGATDHITGEFDWLTMHEPYTSLDQVHTVNGSGMDITQIGFSIIPSSDRDLVLNNVLYVPSTHKILISVHHFTLDNDTFIEFHPFFFLIKDHKTKKVMLHGPCKGGLYPLPPSTSKFQKLVFHAIKNLLIGGIVT